VHNLYVSSTGRKRQPGDIVAGLLAGSWRVEPPPLRLSLSELSSVAALLHRSGLAALAWWPVSLSHLKDTPEAEELTEAYRLQTLQTAASERHMSAALDLLRQAGLDPILFKGWAIAGHYPHAGMRPLGDIDIYLPEEDWWVARVVLARNPELNVPLDLEHADFSAFGSHWNDLRARSRLLPLGHSEVRVLGPEDHLALLCVHFLRHGAWRPIWLCDIAVALETRPSDFDWTICLGPDRLTADRIACALGLAHQLLGADVEGTPVAQRAKRLPKWLVPAVLKQWDHPYANEHPPFSYGEPIATCLRRPWHLLPALVRRWPGPIEATVSVNGPFNELPRFPFQLANVAGRTAAFLARLPAEVRHQG
jgi:Uncharacterised nucleotidyltransferase